MKLKVLREGLDSPTQYEVVPVEFRATGVALTENPVWPDTPHAVAKAVSTLLVPSSRQDFVDQ